MRKLLGHIFVFSTALCCLGHAAFAAIDSASTGNWNSSGTWDSGTTPASGDTLVIPVGVTVTVNCNCGTYNNMRILVFGTLTFPGGRKINLTSNGIVDVFTGGTISGSNNGDKITIDGSAVWTGSQANITGPTTCNDGGCGSNPSLPVELIMWRAYFDEDLEGARLIWETATETQNDYFVIEWSEVEEEPEWRQIAQVKGQGYSTEVTQYESFVHASDLGATNFFRLSQVDFSGDREMLGVVIVANRNTHEGISIFPNPSHGEVYIQSSVGVSYDQVMVLGMGGRLIELEPLNDHGSLRQSLSIDQPGAYILKLYQKGQLVYLQKLMIVSE